MRAAIYGAGAMGTVLGAYVTKNGGKIDLITRNAEHAAALKAEGAHIAGEADFTVAVSALLPQEMTGKYDIVFLMTKQRDNRNILRFVLPYLAEDGIVCTMQNGLPELSVAEVVGRERCCGCAVSWGATFVGRGCARLTTRTDALQFALGTVFENGQKLGRVSDILGLMGKVTIEENFMGARWSKLAINCAFSGISAMTGMSFGQICDDRFARRAAQAILKECFDAAEKCGIVPADVQGHDLKKLLGYNGRIKKFISYMLIPVAMKKHRDIISGMYYDLAAGKKCEIDFINGAAADYAAAHGADCPLNRAVVDAVHGIERGERRPCADNLKVFRGIV